MIKPARERVDTMKNTYSYVDALNEALSLNLSDQCKDKENCPNKDNCADKPCADKPATSGSGNSGNSGGTVVENP